MTKPTRTRIHYEKGRISLKLASPDTGWGQVGDVLAAMTMMEGTGCWFLIDLRLAPLGKPNPYAGAGIGEDFYNEHLPESEDQATKLRATLSEYEERENGLFIWCSFRNIVRGQSSIKGYTPPGYNDFHPPVWHSRKEALDKLKVIQAFWEAHTGSVNEARIANPYLQPTSDQLMSRWTAENILRKSGNIKGNESSV